MKNGFFIIDDRQIAAETIRIIARTLATAAVALVPCSRTTPNPTRTIVLRLAPQGYPTGFL
jgi:hypothetical protein